MTFEISVYFFRAMQLACFLSGVFMVIVSTSEIWSKRREESVSRPRWYFGILAGLMGWSSILAFAPRLFDHMIYWLNPPATSIGPLSVTALLFLYCTSGGLFCVLSGKPKRSFTIFLLILSSSLMSTYLEFL